MKHSNLFLNLDTFKFVKNESDLEQQVNSKICRYPNMYYTIIAGSDGIHTEKETRKICHALLRGKTPEVVKADLLINELKKLYELGATTAGNKNKTVTCNMATIKDAVNLIARLNKNV